MITLKEAFKLCDISTKDTRDCVYLSVLDPKFNKYRGTYFMISKIVERCDLTKINVIKIFANFCGEDFHGMGFIIEDKNIPDVIREEFSLWM